MSLMMAGSSENRAKTIDSPGIVARVGLEKARQEDSSGMGGKITNTAAEQGSLDRWMERQRPSPPSAPTYSLKNRQDREQIALREAPEKDKAIVAEANRSLKELRDGKMAKTSTPPQEWMGDSSGIEDHREIAIKDAAAWEKLWAEHQSNVGIPSPAPAVDFNKYMIVGIFLGERGSSGYSVQLGESETVGDELIIPYKEAVPAPGLMGLTVMTQPYCLKIISRTNRPIRFKKV